MASAPYWFFGGFREVAFGAMFYHEVLSRFDVLESSRDFMSPAIGQLTLEQHRLRRRQDEMRRALASAIGRGAGWAALAELNARVFQRLEQIRTQKRMEVSRLEGSSGRWGELDAEFRARLRALGPRLDVSHDLARALGLSQPEGALSEALLQHFEAEGEFYIDDAGRGPWIRLPRLDETMHATGLSASQVLTGDQGVAVLVLAAVLDYNLSQSPARREDMAYVERLFSLFRHADDALDRRAAEGR